MIRSTAIFKVQQNDPILLTDLDFTPIIELSHESLGTVESTVQT